MEFFYRDAAIVVVRKPAGLLSEERPGGDSLPARIAAALADAGERNTRLYPVHRLDRDTEGLQVFARTPHAAAALSAAFAAGEVEKTYLAVCEGAPAPADGQLADLLYFDRRADKVYVVRRPRGGVKEARLTYHTLATRPLSSADLPAFATNGSAVREENGAAAAAVSAVGTPAAVTGTATARPLPAALSLLAVTLETGRTHQIRAQFAARRHPLCGDGRYGAAVRRGGLALLSAALAFRHPESGEMLSFRLPLPEDWFPFSLFAGTPTPPLL